MDKIKQGLAAMESSGEVNIPGNVGGVGTGIPENDEAINNHEILTNPKQEVT